MWARIGKCFFGFMLVSSAINEYSNYYLQVGRHSYSVVAVVSLLIIVGAIFIMSGIKDQKLLSFFKKSFILILTVLVISVLVVDYGHSFLSERANIEGAYNEHNFSIIFPSLPKVTMFKPNPKAGMIQGGHYLSENIHGVFMVIYYEYEKTINDNHSDQEIADSSLETIPAQMGFVATNRIKSNIQGFLSYKFDVQQKDRNIGKGLFCTANNGIYYVVFLNTRSVVEEKIVNEFFDSFKLLNVNLKKDKA